ncbi:hypothetical protein PDK27_13895 [Bacillus cereus group sp. TH230-1LC]|uniref:hypothetical protein n=1 Tax=Bacillus cereus group sp. BfR-BA-01453 TaxID=2920355 RepID=UPI001F59F1D2|nr:hypothetical protein [Bacillus cereus group sp. BfR-BA-01453]MDA1584880.1 hypothetical protein [Bacillus cereus group sp. TH230-1LC]
MENNDIQFTSLQMRTDKYGWASIQYTNKKQAILYTQNGGVEWDVVNPLNSIVLFAYPINTRSSWVYGLTKTNDDLLPAIFYTVNRGERWSEFILPIEEGWEKSTDVQVQLHATNMDRIWIVLSRKLASNKFEHNLYYLKTKGKVWKVIKNISIRDSISGITFINDLIGFISVQKQYETSVVFKTINGGESWHPIKDIPSLEGMNNGIAMAYKAIYKNNLLVIPTKTNDDKFLMNYSFDKGNSWHISNKTINTSKVAVSFFSSYYGWVINSENGSVYQIIKKGAKWIKVSSNPLLKNVFCLHFFNRRKGWACNKKEIFTTKDRGITWKKVVYKINNINKFI